MSSSYKKSLFKQKTYGSALQSGSHRLLSHQSSENEESSTIYSSSQWRYNKNNPYSQWHGSQRGSSRALGEDHNAPHHSATKIELLCPLDTSNPSTYEFTIHLIKFASNLSQFENL